MKLRKLYMVLCLAVIALFSIMCYSVFSPRYTRYRSLSDDQYQIHTATVHTATVHTATVMPDVTMSSKSSNNAILPNTDTSTNQHTVHTAAGVPNVTMSSTIASLPTTQFERPISASSASSKQVVPTLPDHFIPLTQSEIDGVEKFVLFIGYPRSGHSIIGSYMDSHPNMIIAHEYPLFRTLAASRDGMSKPQIFNKLYKTSFAELQHGWRGEKNVQNKGYSLTIEGLWQATFDKLKVIGNKHGGSMVQFYREYPAIFLRVMRNLKDTVKVPIYLIHVVRNPFDMIATQTLYMDTGIAGVKTNASVENKFNKTRLLASVAKDMLGRAEAAVKLISSLNLPTLELHNEDMIHDTVQVMEQICNFLEVECPGYYLKACAAKTFSSSSKSRHTVVWPQSLLDSIHGAIKNFTFFHQYSFSV